MHLAVFAGSASLNVFRVRTFESRDVAGSAAPSPAAWAEHRDAKTIQANSNTRQGTACTVVATAMAVEQQYLTVQYHLRRGITIQRIGNERERALHRAMFGNLSKAYIALQPRD